MSRLLLALLLTMSLAHAGEYRIGAAEQVYKLHNERVYRGVMPPLLYAVGIVQITVDSSGAVTSITWLRKPANVVAEQIESLILTPGMFGIPPEGSAVFVETWLWDKSGKFQLKSLSEGQR
jgi:protein TonB